MHSGSTDQARYDYIVVGSGAGGGPLAGNLAKARRRVLLLEAGADYYDYNYQIPAFHGFATEDEHMRWDYFVRHYADDAHQSRDPKFRAEQGGVLYPRAGTLGGCTAHNAMITVYPHNRDWDRIAELTGDDSWRSSSMRGYFERLERCRYVDRPLYVIHNQLLARIIGQIPWISRILGNATRHGFNGWLSTELPDPRILVGGLDEQLLKILISAGVETLEDVLGRRLSPLEGLSFLDPNDWRVQVGHAEGIWLVPLATRAGKRNGTREYIRRVARQHPNNLMIKLNALVTRVLFADDNTAIGVEYLDGGHLYRADPLVNTGACAAPVRQALAAREVILCGGAFNSPQLLKLSGIGPREELTRLGIPVRVDLPGVGENLQDRYEVGIISEMDSDFALLQGCRFETPQPGQPLDPCFDAWQAGEGVYTTNGALLGIIKRSSPERLDPDLFIFGLPARFEGYFPGYSQALARYRRYFTWAILKAHTRNAAGTVTLKSADPRDVPEINFRYFEEGSDSDRDDLASMVFGVEFVRRIMDRSEGRLGREVLPGPQVRSREDIEQFIRDQAWGHHASGTCKIGPDDDKTSVLDSHFRVRGVRGLRVVDASVFPWIPGFFIVSSVYMISEKASDVILQDEGMMAPIARRVATLRARVMGRP